MMLLFKIHQCIKKAQIEFHYTSPFLYYFATFLHDYIILVSSKELILAPTKQEKNKSITILKEPCVP